jgi:hypothetical protein
MANESRQAQQQFLQQNPYVSEQQPLWQFKPPEWDAMKGFGSTASVLGILMGALTRGGLTASLNASAAAMTAMRSNDLMAYKEAKDTWEKNTKIALENAKAQNEAIDRGLKLMKDSYGEGIAAIQTAGSMYHNQVMAGIASAEAAQNMKIRAQQATDAHNKAVEELRRHYEANAEAFAAAETAHPELKDVFNTPAEKRTPGQQQQVDSAVSAARRQMEIEKIRAERGPQTATDQMNQAKYAEAAQAAERKAGPEKWNTLKPEEKQALIGYELDAQGKPTTTAQNLVYNNLGLKLPPENAEKVVSSIRTAGNLEALIKESGEEAVAKGFGKVGFTETMVTNWITTNLLPTVANPNAGLTTARQTADAADALAANMAKEANLRDSDKFIVFYKKAIFEILEAERAARGGSLLPVGVMNALTPLLDPKGLSQAAFARIMQDRADALMTSTNLDSKQRSALSSAIAGLRPGGGGPSVGRYVYDPATNTMGPRQ